MAEDFAVPDGGGGDVGGAGLEEAFGGDGEVFAGTKSTETAGTITSDASNAAFAPMNRRARRTKSAPPSPPLFLLAEDVRLDYPSKP